MSDLNWILNRYRMKFKKLRKTISTMKIFLYVLSVLLIGSIIFSAILFNEYHSREILISELEENVISLSERIKKEDSVKNIVTYAGKFTITSYCSCEKCCGEWAKNRPMLENREIVITSSGSIAEQGITIAVDPDVIPYGTKLYIEGIGIRVAQDTGKVIKGNRLDVYYDSHEEAQNEGIYSRDVWILAENL